MTAPRALPLALPRALPPVLLLAMLVLPAPASAHGLLATGEIAIVFEVVDTLEQHCVKATVFFTEASPAADWSEAWSFRNRYNPQPGEPVREETGGDSHSHGVFVADSHSHVAYDQCFAGGAHGDLDVSASLVARVAGVIVDDHGVGPLRCHWGHSPASL